MAPPSSSAVVLRLRSKPQTLTLRLFSSSSAATPPPDLPEEPPSASSSSSSPLSDVKSHLRNPSAEPRRIPLNPPKPDLLSSPPSATTLQEIRRNLAEFRRRSAPPPEPISFQDLYRNSLRGNDSAADSPSAVSRPSFDAIRDSLRQLRERGPTTGLPGLFRETSRADETTLPRSIFGREMDGKGKGEADGKKERKTDFLRMYSYEELGERLRVLRQASPEGKVVPFSLGELNERLARLREMEDRESESRIGGVSFRELRDSLQKLKDAEASKKSANLPSMLLLPHIGRDSTPDYMLGPPKEHLVEKYFHPDLMSAAEKLKLELKRVRDEFKMSESDCGSARVQVAQLTTKIKYLSSVLRKKDKHSQKGLQAMVQRRKKLLKYLRRTDWDSYCFVLTKLGLRDASDYRT